MVVVVIVVVVVAVVVTMAMATTAQHSAVWLCSIIAIYHNYIIGISVITP